MPITVRNMSAISISISISIVNVMDRIEGAGGRNILRQWGRAFIPELSYIIAAEP